MIFLREFLDECLNILPTRIDVERRGEVGRLHGYPAPARRWSGHEGHGQVNAIDPHEGLSRASSTRIRLGDFGNFPMLRQLPIPLIQTTCFFCQSHVNPLPRDPRNFKCPHCQCWNRYDASGEITSDEPAMHEPGLNAKSFARRGERVAPLVDEYN